MIDLVMRYRWSALWTAYIVYCILVVRMVEIWRGG